MSEFSSADSVCHDLDGCPTEGAVLKRYWRETQEKITQLQAEVEALRKNAAWQPIETAPKDGNEIIMSNGKDVSSGSWFNGSDGTCDRDGAPNCDERESCWMDWGAGMQPEPTHWKPLPQPPAIKEQV